MIKTSHDGLDSRDTTAAPSSGSVHSRSLQQDEKDAQNHIPPKTEDAEHQAIPSPAAEDVPPNGGFGWICVICTALINAHTWGINSSYGVFLSYYLSSSLFPGATSLDYALVGGLSIAAAMLVSPLATYSTGRWGTRTTLLIGVFFETLSLIGASFAGEMWQLFLSQGACFGIGMGFLFVGTVGIIPQWFTTKRSLANGAAAGGSGLGGLTYSLATGAMIPRIGLAWTFRVLGIISCIVNFTCSITIKDRNKVLGVRQVPFDYRLFKRKEYLLMEAWAFFSLLGYVVLLFSLPNFAVTMGLNQQQAAVIGALLNLSQGIGRPLVGMFSDAGGRINLATILTVLCGLFCFIIWIFAKSYGVLIFFSLIVGCVAGTIWTTIGPVSAEVVGLQDLPAALSMTWLVVMLPSMFSEAIALEIVAATQAAPTPATEGNSYLYAQIFTGLMYFAAGGCAWFLRAWKIGQLEMTAAEEGKGLGAVDAVKEGTDGVGLKVKEDMGKNKSNIVHRLFVPKRV